MEITRKLLDNCKFTPLNTTLLCLVLLLVIPRISPAQNLTNFNNNWLFTESDSVEYPLTTYNPKNLKKIDLPHDWTIEHGFDKSLEGCTAFMPGGIAWYSKIFATTITENQKCFIIFDGVYNNAEFWLNGIRIGNHPYGYAPIYYDVSDLLAPKGEENRLSVRVDRSRYADSRWYTGSGIYRNMQLLIVDKLHIPVWGTFITTPKIENNKATISIKIELENDYNTEKRGTLETDIINPEGEIVANEKIPFLLEAKQKTELTHETEIANPALWGVDNPRLYKSRTRIVISNKILEERITRFGIRNIHHDKDKGFFLNGKNIKIKGVCLHHDSGIVGAALPKDVWKRRLHLLKEMGCNAIRSAHNPASDEFLDLCDEMGFLVQNEFYDEWDLPKDKSIYKSDGNNSIVEKKKDYWKTAPRVWQAVNPYWNYSKGDEIVVEVYSNCEEVELFQNGTSLGNQYLKNQKDYTYKWAVKYKDGKLMSMGKKGKQIISKKLETASKPVAIKLSTDRTSLPANNTDVVHVIAELIDKKGRKVKNIDKEISFIIEGDHRFLGTDCGNTDKIKNFKSKTVQTEFGKCLLVAQATNKPSVMKIKALTKDGDLSSKKLEIKIIKTEK